MSSRHVAIVPVLFAVLCTTGCGQSGQSKSRVWYHRSAAHVPACAHAGKAIDLPRGFPADFPLPPHTVITSHTRSFGALIVEGFVPASSFDAAHSFFLHQLPDAGYHLSNRDSEPPREAEARYDGNGYQGGWRLRSVLNCPKVFSLQASATPTH